MKTSVRCPKCTFKKAKHSGVYSPSIEEVETRGCLGLAGQTAESNWQAPRPSERLLKKGGQLLRCDRPLASRCTHIHAPSHRGMYTQTHTPFTHRKRKHTMSTYPLLVPDVLAEQLGVEFDSHGKCLGCDVVTDLQCLFRLLP